MYRFDTSFASQNFLAAFQGKLNQDISLRGNLFTVLNVSMGIGSVTFAPGRAQRLMAACNCIRST